MRAPPKRLDPGTAHGQEQPAAESIYTVSLGAWAPSASLSGLAQGPGPAQPCTGCVTSEPPVPSPQTGDKNSNLAGFL